MLKHNYTLRTLSPIHYPLPTISDLDTADLFCDTSAPDGVFWAFVFSVASNEEVEIMVVRISRILSAGIVVVVLANVQPAMCSGWSLPNPFASKSEKKKSRVTPVKKQEPSFLEKIGDGTKDFFDRTGETLGLKKPAAKKYQYATPQRPHAAAPKSSQSDSWLPSMYPPEESKKPKTVTDWMSQPRQDM